MLNIILIVVLSLCALQQAEFQILENDSYAEPTVLPYSLKAVANKQDSRYTLMTAVKSSSSGSQAEEQQLADESSNMKILQNRRTEEDPWERISVHYKNQLAQTKAPSNEFEFYNLNGAAATHNLNVGNHFGFGVGVGTAPLPLVLMLIVNIGVLIYLVFGIITTLSAAATGGFNYRLPPPPPPPHHVYFRKDDQDAKFL